MTNPTTPPPARSRPGGIGSGLNGTLQDEPIPADDLDPAILTVGELGHPGNIQTVYSTRGRREFVPKWSDPNRLLRFPESVKVYDVMLRTDDQVGSVMEALTLPILDAPWDLDDKGCRPGVADFVRSEIGLPKPGESPENRRRHQAGIVFREHLEEALDCLGYGFQPFEQVYSTTFPGEPGHPKGPLFTGQPAVHLRKLAARPPATIYRIRVAPDGGLVSLIQYPIEGDTDWQVSTDGYVGIELPVNRLVMYVTKRKGADWSGVSVLRTAYRPWKIKEELCRLDAIASERNSLGIPMVEYDPTMMTREAALEIATAARSGAEAGIAVPVGCRFSFAGAGSAGVVDLGPKIDRYNESIGRASLAMFLNLGHDNGARSLGDTFLSFFTRALQSVAGRMANTFTEHVIRDLVEWNWGPDETYPRLVPGEITAEMALAPEAFKALIEAKVIIPDDKLEEQVRRRYRLPAANKATSRQDKPPEPKPAPAPVMVGPDGLPVKPAAPKPPAAGSPAGAGGGGSTKPNPFKPVPEPSLNADADDQPDQVVEPDVPLPDGLVHVPAHTRKWPGGKASLAGYAAFLAGQVRDAEDIDVDDDGR